MGIISYTITRIPIQQPVSIMESKAGFFRGSRDKNQPTVPAIPFLGVHSRLKKHIPKHTPKGSLNQVQKLHPELDAPVKLIRFPYEVDHFPVDYSERETSQIRLPVLPTFPRIPISPTLRNLSSQGKFWEFSPTFYGETPTLQGRTSYTRDMC